MRICRGNGCRKSIQQSLLLERYNEIEDVLRQCIDAGQLPETFQTRQAALIMRSYVNGMMESWLFTPGKFDLVADAPELVDALIDMLRLSPTLAKRLSLCAVRRVSFVIALNNGQGGQHRFHRQLVFFKQLNQIYRQFDLFGAVSRDIIPPATLYHGPDKRAILRWRSCKDSALTAKRAV